MKQRPSWKTDRFSSSQEKLAFYFHILMTMHGQNHIKFDRQHISALFSIRPSSDLTRWTKEKSTTLQSTYTKGILVCYVFVSVIFNGLLKFVGTVIIRGFDTFSSRKSRDSGECVNYCSTLQLSSRRYSYGVYIYYVKGCRFSH